MDSFDVAVIGGGVAGLCAAIQAGRAGAKTVLIEKNGICGGTLTFCGINYPGIFDAWGKSIIRGIGWELIERTLEATGAKLPEYYLEKDSNKHHGGHQIGVDQLMFATLADDLLLDAGVDIRYHTMLGSLAEKDGKWRIVLCGKDGLYEVESTIVTDCTGDANATRLAGWPYIERKTTQPGTLSIYTHNYDMDKLDWTTIENHFKDAVESGKIDPTDVGWTKTFNRGFLYGHGGNCNHICGINAADSEGRTRMEIEGRRSIRRAYRFLREQPGLEQIEFHIKSGECGVRETRVIDGEYMISEQDYLSGRTYPDAVCNAFYKIDLHDSEYGLVNKPLSPEVVPQVPLRALIPRGSKNFLAAGRLISSDRLANSALRVQAVCMATGQAAGCIAALSALQGRTPLDIPPADWKKVLRENNAIVP